MPYSTNGDLEQLIEQITDVIVARLNELANEAMRLALPAAPIAPTGTRPPPKLKSGNTSPGTFGIPNCLP